jgi:hypothetical protein
MQIDEKRLADDVVRLVVECTELKALLRKTRSLTAEDDARVAELTAARYAC